MRKQQADKSSPSQTAARESDPAEKAYQAMEDLLGKAAARSWKVAKDTAAAPPNIAPPAGPSNDCSSFTAMQQTSLGLQAKEARPESMPVVQSSPDSSSAAKCAMVGDVQPAAGSSSSATVSSLSTPRLGTETFLGTAVTTAEHLLTVAAASTDPAESLKLQLAAVGVRDPAEVSRVLMEEVVARADLIELLSGVAEILERKGLPRRLSKHSSLKITRELNKR
jgi:hypothetical protein